MSTDKTARDPLQITLSIPQKTSDLPLTMHPRGCWCGKCPLFQLNFKPDKDCSWGPLLSYNAIHVNGCQCKVCICTHKLSTGFKDMRRVFSPGFHPVCCQCLFCPLFWITYENSGTPRHRCLRPQHPLDCACCDSTHVQDCRCFLCESVMKHPCRVCHNLLTTKDHVFGCLCYECPHANQMARNNDHWMALWQSPHVEKCQCTQCLGVNMFRVSKDAWKVVDEGMLEAVTGSQLGMYCWENPPYTRVAPVLLKKVPSTSMCDLCGIAPKTPEYMYQQISACDRTIINTFHSKCKANTYGIVWYIKGIQWTAYGLVTSTGNVSDLMPILKPGFVATLSTITDKWIRCLDKQIIRDPELLYEHNESKAVVDQFVCSLCLLVMFDPVCFPCAGSHLFCRLCIVKYRLLKPNNNLCSLCKETCDMSLVRLSPETITQICLLKTPCLNRENGCPAVFPFGLKGKGVHTHREQCSHRLTTCSQCNQSIEFLERGKHKCPPPPILPPIPPPIQEEVKEITQQKAERKKKRRRI